MAFAQTARPLIHVAPTERVNYLKKVLLWTSGALLLSAMTGAASAVVLYLATLAGMSFLLSGYFPMILILGCFAVAHYLCPRLVFGNAKVLGLGLAAIFQGMAMGFLLLTAVSIGIQSGNPLGLVINALMLTGLTGGGMLAYVWSNPKEFRMLGAALSALFLPMMLLMGISFVFPSLLGGTLGLGVTALFVVISAASLAARLTGSSANSKSIARLASR